MKWLLCLTTALSTTSGLMRTLQRPFLSTRLLSTEIGNAPTESSNLHQVYVGNLPFDVAKETLESLIRQRTNSFQSMRLIMNRETGLSRGFAFLDYNTREEADEASAALAGIEMDGRQLKVDSIGLKGEKPPVARRGPRDRAQNTAQVFIGNLDIESSEEDVRSIMQDEIAEGKVVSIRIGRDRDGKCRGFAHLDCTDAAAAEEIVSKLNGMTVKDRQIRADFATKREVKSQRERSSGGVGRGGSHSIFVANLPWEATPELIGDMVNDLVGEGSFVRARLAVDKESGRPRGFGHIDLSSAEAAERAVREIDGVDLMGRELRADFATERGDRRKGSNREKGDRYDNNRGNEGSFGSW